jgi:threonine dehydrogenase-like Zn-dependent dehydrogenase
MTVTAATASAASSTAAAADSAAPCAGRAVVVGGGPAGLAAAIGLARQAGFRVDVFDMRQNPANDSHSSKEALLVALGEVVAVLPSCALKLFVLFINLSLPVELW